ncbi:spore protease YyaC [Paenibacillus beijingensis]|uniref:Sporulation protein n=1 Tax=Paenibacillus beijingensis TaxID=1126833 RepID=A0A0D5NHY3_9BACL|nr:spore protease YyaC [Paenibacillus beijingensis]AJY74881.1 sporulation protein [Paenibacillus beijingensis]
MKRFQEKDFPVKVLHTDSDAAYQIGNRLQSLLELVPDERRLVIVCIGTDRSTGDSLGPLVGTALEKYNSRHYDLFGTLDDPVHAMNLEDTMNTIYRRIPNPYIIGIDACLGQVSSVGCIQLGTGPVRPGAGVNKELPPVGDFHITGIVNVGGFMEYFVLQNTRLNLVIRMADMIASTLHQAICDTRLYTIRAATPD